MSETPKTPNPQAFPTTCKWCEDAPYKKSGRIHLCKKHSRFLQMRVTAKRCNKKVPSYKELDQLLVESGFKCQNCGTDFNWTQKEGTRTVITLQHDDSGAFKFLCLSCNTVHASTARDLIYSMGPNDKYCKRCQSIKPKDAFYKDRHTVNGYKSWCMECSNKNSQRWRVDKKDDYNAYQRLWRSKNKRMLEERTKHIQQ